MNFLSKLRLGAVLALFLSAPFYAAEQALADGQEQVQGSIQVEEPEEEQKGVAAQEAKACPICLDNKIEGFINRSAALTLACGHTMCLSCAPATLQAHPACPECRRPIDQTIVNLLARGAGAQLAMPRLVAAPQVARGGVQLEDHKSTARSALLFSSYFMALYCAQHYGKGFGHLEKIMSFTKKNSNAILFIRNAVPFFWELEAGHGQAHDSKAAMKFVRKLSAEAALFNFGKLFVLTASKTPDEVKNKILKSFGLIGIGLLLNELFEADGKLVPAHRQRMIHALAQIQRYASEKFRSMRAAIVG